MAKIDNLIRDFKTSKTPSIAPADGCGVGVIFDVILREDHRRESQISSYPTETAFNGNDHTIHKNPTLTLTVGVSDNSVRMKAAQATNTSQMCTPYPTAGKFDPNVSGLINAGTGVAGGLILSKLGGTAAAAIGLAAESAISAFAGSDRRSVDVWNALDRMRTWAVMVNVVGTKGDYKNYRIVRLSETVDKEVEGGGIFEIGLEQPIIFSSKSTPVQINSNIRQNDPAATRGAATTNLGEVPTRNG